MVSERRSTSGSIDAWPRAKVGSWVTDEASAVEQLGLKPRLVAGSRENLKVTYPEDLAIAEAILVRRELR